MNKRIIAYFLTFSLVFITLTGCTKLQNMGINIGNKASTQVENAETPYYYVTNGKIIKDKNYYMELEVKIPTIKYSNEESDALVDQINAEMETKINAIIEEDKDYAYETYQKYLSTAKSGIENEKAKKLDELKAKYKSIIGDAEVKAISAVTSEGIHDIATTSFITVDGFTNSEDIINEGPHNKRIVIIDKTSSESIKQSSIEINGRPGKKQTTVPPEINMPSYQLGQDINIASVSYTKKFESENELKKPNIATKSIPNFGMKKGFGKMPKEFNKKASASNTNEEISLKNFYRDLAAIRRIRVPNHIALATAYTPMYIYCDFDVKCLDKDFISIYVNIYESRTQIHSNVLVYNIDLKNKKIITIKDLLGDNYKELCNNLVNKAIESWSEDKKVLLQANHKIEDYITDDMTFFININHHPVIVFDKYSIAGGAAGYPEFEIKK